MGSPSISRGLQANNIILRYCFKIISKHFIDYIFPKLDYFIASLFVNQLYNMIGTHDHFKKEVKESDGIQEELTISVQPQTFSQAIKTGETLT